jgi:hypothetical protein
VSGWEIFSWINVAILGVGAVLVFAAFLRDLPELLARQRRSEGEIFHGEDED